MSSAEMVEMEEKLTTEHEIKIKGALIVVLAEILKQRQVEIWDAIDIAVEMEEDKGVIERLMSKADVNEVAGCIVLKMMQDAMGEKFMIEFCNGDFKFSTSPGRNNETLN